MASNFIGMNRGGDQKGTALVIGTSTGSTDMEIRLDQTKNLTKKDVQLFLCILEKHFLSNGIDVGGTAGANMPPL